MVKPIFVPIADQVTSGTYLVHDGICDNGGLLTVDDERAVVGRWGASRDAAELAGQLWPLVPVPGAAPMETVNVAMPPLVNVAVSAA